MRVGEVKGQRERAVVCSGKRESKEGARDWYREGEEI